MARDTDVETTHSLYVRVYKIQLPAYGAGPENPLVRKIVDFRSIQRSSNTVTSEYYYSTYYGRTVVY